MNAANMRCIVVLLVFLVAQCAPSPRSTYWDSPHCATPRLKNGRIRARGRGRIIRYSCYADFELVGNKYSTCIRGSWDTPTPICVSNRCPAVPVPKHAVVGEKYHGAILMYFCEPGYVLVGNAEIYCDGRQWNGTTPYCRDILNTRNSNAVAPTSCDFEKGLCWWEQDPKHDFDWIRYRFDTPSAHIGTGPTHDHTLGPGNDGYYLYIEATGRLINDTARIISPLYNANLTESGCFSFWYHMYGLTVGSLNVYFKPETESTPKLMWSKHGHQGNQWRRGLFNLPTVNSSFQIIIEGIRGTSYVSDIAIDDVAILQGDECIIKNITINTTPAPDGDEVEVFNAMQSCRDRCVNTSLETTPSFELYSNPDVCQCTLDCAETSSCCPDYAEYCIYEVSDQPSDVTTPITIVPSTKDTITSVAVNTSTEHNQKDNETTTSVMTTNKAEKTTTESTTTTTATTTTTSTTEATTKIKITTETFVFTTSKKPTRATTTTTLAPTTTTEVEMPFVPVIQEITEDSINDLETRTEAHVFIEDAKPLKKSTAFSLSGMIGIIIGVLTGFTIIAMAALIIYRRRKFYTRSSDGSPYSEDCTVGFLASVETLDFSLAKPSEDDEKL